MSSNANRPRRRLSCVPAAESLETRQVLTGGAGNTIAIMTGQIVEAAKPATLQFTVDPKNFTLARGRIALGIDLVPSSSSQASPVLGGITDSAGKSVGHKTYASGKPVTSQGQPISPAQIVDLKLSSPLSRKSTSVSPRTYTVSVQGKNNTTGGFLAGYYLVGDTDGDGTVEKKDLGAIRKALGSKAGDTKYNFDADANRDGRISATDMSLAQKNMGAKTTIMPLITADLSLDSDTGTADRVTTIQNVTLTGVASTGATVTYAEVDAKTANTAATADATGKYSITIPLAEGTNTFYVSSSDSFGQTIAGTIAPITYNKPKT